MIHFIKAVKSVIGRKYFLVNSQDTSDRHSRPKYDLEALESRVLLSGDIGAVVIPPPPQQSFTVAELLTMDPSSFPTFAPQTTPSPSNTGSQLQEAPSTTLPTPVDMDQPVSHTDESGTDTSLISTDGSQIQTDNSPALPTNPSKPNDASINGAVNTVNQTSSRTYFISPSGSDTNDGSAPSHALKTLAAVNTLQLMPGDIVSLEGGASFEGRLVIHNSGLPDQPIQVTSFATTAGDRAEILAGEGDGIVLQNVEHVLVSNLKVTGVGPSVNQGQGIMLLHDDANNRRLEDIQIDNVEASGFRYAGIAMYTGGTLRYGYQDVRVTHADVHDNGFAGMWMGSAPGNYPDHPDTYAYENVYVGYSQFHDNQGLAINEQTGNGIFLKDVNGGIIEHCQAYNNGALNQTANGPVGIWAVYSNNVVIQFNESYGNRTQGGDGDGFDLDGGTTNSVLQYNHSHDNAGPGFLVYQFNDSYRATSSGNIVRYNISENDCRQGTDIGAIDIRAQSSPEVNTQVYGNTIYLDGAAANTASISGLRTSGNVNNAQLFDNFVMTAGGVRLVETQGALESASFQGNHYSSDGYPVIISAGGVTYGSVEEWRIATQQENGSSAF